MKRRFIASAVATALVSIVVLGVPLLLLARHQVWTSERDKVHEQATGIATGLEDRLDAGQPIDLSHFARAMPGRHIEVRTQHGLVAQAGPQASGRPLLSTVTVAESTITVAAPLKPILSRLRNVTLLVCGGRGTRRRCRRRPVVVAGSTARTSDSGPRGSSGCSWQGRIRARAPALWSSRGRSGRPGPRSQRRAAQQPHRNAT